MASRVGESTKITIWPLHVLISDSMYVSMWVLRWSQVLYSTKPRRGPQAYMAGGMLQRPQRPPAQRGSRWATAGLQAPSGTVGERDRDSDGIKKYCAVAHLARRPGRRPSSSQQERHVRVLLLQQRSPRGRRPRIGPNASARARELARILPDPALGH